MKATGVVRQIDELGRIVLPAEIRKCMGIKKKDSIEIFTDDERIILQKYNPSCTFCNSTDSIVLFREKRICKECLETLKQQL